MKKLFATISVCGLILLVVYGIFFMYFSTQTRKFDEQVATNLVEAHETFAAIPIWHKKIATDQVIKIGLITDTHVRPNRINHASKAEDAPRYLNFKDKAPIERFVSRMNQFHPDFVVHLGDVIEGTKDNYYIGTQGERFVQEELGKIGVPIHWVVGNHDLRSLTKEQFQQTLGLDTLDQTFDMGDYRFIIVDGNYNFENLPRTPTDNVYIRGKLPPQTITWLKKQLETDKRVFIFIHQGTFLHDVPGDPEEPKEEEDVYDEEGGIIEEAMIGGTEYYMKQSLFNAQELNDILKEYRVDGIFNGHMEARAYEKNDFTAHYSLTGTKKSELYPQSYYELTIAGAVPDVTMYYMPTDSAIMKAVDFESGEK